MMLERLYFTTIQRGFEDLRSQPFLLEGFFSGMGLDLTEIRSARTWFETANPTVNQAYPRHGASRFPGVFIVLASEKESQKFLNDFADEISYAEAAAANTPELGGALVKTAIYEFNHNFFVVADNPDKCIYLAQLVRYILMSQREELARHGLLTLSIAATDVAPNPEYLPETFFVRRLAIESMAEAPVHVIPEQGQFRPIQSVDADVVGRDCDM